ncbi:glucosamine-6-phosphate deaminase [Dyadobacter jejuensis]|uniref:Glucosamine-6-phosphate deaminase n=1 Tax=Dyadobacter jejuensis TaxID=1082580 RepID=A0A316ATA9_9BACT|nr:glucosamine-6-phosphate deaminase [Dyadobacter jejuensis]PWJ53377.1 glucosamine-6-phosphate deaminase [Dyadobacter jejuensis]
MNDQGTTFEAGLLKVQYLPTRLELGKMAALQVAQRIHQLQQEQQMVHVIFASAPSQNEFLEALCTDPLIDWQRVRAFHMDEYLGLASDAPQNFGYFLKVRLFDRVPIEEVYYLDGNATDLQAECDRYAALLEEYPTDVVCLGIGENGHLAFNDPHIAFFDDPKTVKVVELDQPCRQQQVNDKCFETLELVPLLALTVTIPALMKARYVYGMVPGKNKADAIRHTLEGPVSETHPSTILKRHPEAFLFIDRDSAGKLSNFSSL